MFLTGNCTRIFSKHSTGFHSKHHLHISSQWPRSRTVCQARHPRVLSQLSSMPGRRFGIINCEDAEKWKGLEKFWVDATGEPDDAYEVFEACSHKWPTVEEAQGFDGLLLTGSHYSAYDDSQTWIPELAQILKAYVDAGDVRIMGCCFGHQILARALGGRVDKNPSGRFVLKVEEIELLPEMLNWEECMGNAAQKSWKIIEAHGDQVVALPPKATLLGRSPTASHEIWRLEDKVLAFQSHPEFSVELTVEKIFKYLKKNRTLSKTEAKESYASFANAELDSSQMKSMIRKFLHSQPPKSQTLQQASTSTQQVQEQLNRMYNATTTSLADAFPLSSMTRSLSSAFKKGTGANSSTSDSVETGSRGGVNGQELRDALKDSAEDFLSKFSALMRLELERGLLEYDKLDIANQLAGAEFLKLVDCVKDVGEANKDLQAHHQVQSTETQLVLDELSEIVSSLEIAVDKLDTDTRQMQSMMKS